MVYLLPGLPTSLQAYKVSLIISLPISVLTNLITSLPFGAFCYGIVFIKIPLRSLQRDFNSIPLLVSTAYERN